ncbi:MAG: hypothetical protein K2Q20_09740, partial [Phycisphaerales bacterium]|nr:hypothetical protein [Phycisphaerales bacterium]
GIAASFCGFAHLGSLAYTCLHAFLNLDPGDDPAWTALWRIAISLSTVPSLALTILGLTTVTRARRISLAILEDSR